MAFALRDAEDKYVTGKTGWKGLATSFALVDAQMKRIPEMKNNEKVPLLKIVDDNIHRIQFYNKYSTMPLSPFLTFFIYYIC